MPHAPANQLDALSIETFLKDSGGPIGIKVAVAANGTFVAKGVMKPGIYGLYFKEDVSQDESCMGEFIVHMAADGFADVLTDPVAASFGAGAGIAIFDTGGAAAAATEINVTIASTGIMTVLLGASIAAGQLYIWKKVGFVD